MAEETVSLFAPGDYTSREAEITRLQKLADMLSQMSQQEIPVSTAGGITAPVSPYSALAKALTSFGGSYLAGKSAADEAALRQSDNAHAAEVLANFLYKPGTQQPPVSNPLPLNAPTSPRPLPLNAPTSPRPLPINAQTSPNQSALPEQPSGQPSTPSVQAKTAPGEPTSYADRVKAFLELASSDSPAIQRMLPFLSQLLKPEHEAIGARGVIERDPVTGQERVIGQPPEKPAMTPAEIANIKIRIKEIALQNGRDAARAAYEGIGGIPGFDADTFLNEILGTAPAASKSTAPTPSPTAPPVPNTNSSFPQKNPPAQKVGSISNEKTDLPWVDSRSSHWSGTSPKDKMAGIADLRKNQLQEKNNAFSQLGTIDRLTNGVDDLLKNPGLDKISGPIAQYTWPFSTEGQAARNTFNSLASAAAIQQINDLRASSKAGGAVGNVTEAEWERLSNAAGMLGRATGPDDVRRNLNNYKNILSDIKDRINNTYFTVYGEKLNYKPVPYQSFSASRPPPGWTLQQDAHGNKAYVSPDGKNFQEVNP